MRHPARFGPAVSRGLGRGRPGRWKAWAVEGLGRGRLGPDKTPFLANLQKSCRKIPDPLQACRGSRR